MSARNWQPGGGGVESASSRRRSSKSVVGVSGDLASVVVLLVVIPGPLREWKHQELSLAGAGETKRLAASF